MGCALLSSTDVARVSLRIRPPIIPKGPIVIEYLQTRVLNDPYLTVALFFLVAICLQLVFWLIVRSGQRQLAARIKTGEKRPADDILLRLLQRTSILSMIAAGCLLAVVFVPTLPDHFVNVLFKVCLLILFVQVGAWASALVNHSLQHVLEFFNVADSAGASALGVMRFFALSVVWVAIFLLVLQNMNIQITPLLTGLGIGGIAIAFALQAILGDVFCSVAIILDKPFEVGDFIVLDPGTLGTVERIGIKTTRVRSLTGEELVLSNADLLGSRIHNFKRMQIRRVAQMIGIEYDTPLDVMKRVPEAIERIVKGTEQVRFDRCHLKDFGACSFDYELVYWVLSADFNVHMNCRQHINFGIVNEFRRMGVEFAFPTQTVHVSRTTKKHLDSGSTAGSQGSESGPDSDGEGDGE